jgi:hypothetical protein
MGMAPNPRSGSFLAASSMVSFSPTHSAWEGPAAAVAAFA